MSEESPEKKARTITMEYREVRILLPASSERLLVYAPAWGKKGFFLAALISTVARSSTLRRVAAGLRSAHSGSGAGRWAAKEPKTTGCTSLLSLRRVLADLPRAFCHIYRCKC